MKHIFLFIALAFFSPAGISQERQPPNIILIIGDGMGLTQISAGMYSNNNSTILEEFEGIGLSKTHASDKLVTDSAASGTAMACGVKTYNGAVGVDSRRNQLRSILEICQEHNYTTGLIVTSSIVHATPASFYANVAWRKEYEEIALQLRNHKVDVFIGGGEKYFKKRKDNRNLIDEMTSYEFVKNLPELKKSRSEKIGYFTYEEEPPSLLKGRKPALNEAAKAVLENFKKRRKPFFLMIEGSQIDWGGHSNNLDYVVSEFKEFDNTLSEVLSFAKTNGNTLVVVTADHETGGLAITRGELKDNKVGGEFVTKHHSATMVPVFSFGPQSENFIGVYENTAIFDKMLLAVQN